MSAWPIVIVWLASSVVMFVGWLAQRRSRNADIVDILWSLCMAASAVFYAAVASGAGLPRVLVALLGGSWGLRLALHLFRRVHAEAEDGRYAYLRAYWRDDQKKFFAFFMVQALFTALFSWPFYIAASNPVESWTIWTSAALLIWLVGLGGETLADRQLAAWRTNPANQGRTCRAGLWRWSRHPNYFFEIVHWFAYVFIAIGVGGYWPFVCLLGPALMLASLCWLTGIPYAEAQALRSRGEDYRAYQRTTSVLLPWPPRD